MEQTALRYRPLPSIETLKDHFQVVPIGQIGIDSGLIWIKPTLKYMTPGSLAGFLDTHSKQDRRDWKVVFGYKRYYVSRIVYAIHHGVDPGPLTVDHIDRDPLNNSIDNLELVDRSTQNRNRRLHRNNTSGARGVSRLSNSEGWTAQIHAGGEPVRLGVFDCKIKAALAYNDALRQECQSRYESLRNKIENIHCGCSQCVAALLDNPVSPPSENV